MTFVNINHCWAGLMVEELTRLGADYFCVAPGSRSSPLVIAVAQNKNAKSFVHFDERGLSFHAMGYAAATDKPAVLICTSGTAAANFFPAVIEASKKKLPLIVLTADRPPELRQTGAAQTIDQVGIFRQIHRVDNRHALSRHPYQSSVCFDYDGPGLVSGHTQPWGSAHQLHVSSTVDIT